MDTRQLAAFCAVVERRSFSQAADQLGVTQPAVSLQVRALEKRLGTQLRYCGSFHFERESGHAVNADHAELARIPLDAETRARYIALADEVYAIFEPWTHELLRYALAHPVSAPVADPETDGVSQVMTRSSVLAA